MIGLIIEMDINRDWTYGDSLADISGYVENIKWRFGSNEAFRQIAAPGTMSLKLHNNGDLDYEDPEAAYYDKFRVGTLIRVRAWNGSSYEQMVAMKITSFTPKIEGEDKKLYIECSDILDKFLDAEYIAPLQTNVRVDEALSALHATDKAIYPYASYYAFIEFNTVEDGTGPFDGSEFTDFEEAETTLLFIGDNMGKENKMRVQSYVRDAVEAEFNGLYFFDCRNELFKFFNSNHAGDAAVSWTLIDEFEAEYSKPRQYMTNEYTVNYAPRQIGAEDTVLFESDSVPITVEPLGTVEIVARYADPNNPSATIGALEVKDPVMGVDVIANSKADGTGINRTSVVYVSLIKGAASSKILIHSRRRKSALYITTLKLKGTPIGIYNKESITEINLDSVYRHESVPSNKTLYGVSDLDTAQAYARFMVDTFGEPSEMVVRLKVVATAENYQQVISRTIGDVIRVIDTKKNHDDTYMIVGEEHFPQHTAGKHVVTYTLRSVGRGSAFTLGTSYYDEGDVLGL